ncbi:MAG: hypothetical protein ACREJU_06485 [Nitrospiraceae bacterium]
MSNFIRKPLQKNKNAKCIRKTKPYRDWGRLGLNLKEKATVPIEEMRRQGLTLAGRQFEQGARSRGKMQEDSESLEKKARPLRRESPWA